jgi:serine/threonine protein kinase
MENYEYIEEIGSGTYGTVYLASVRDAPSEVVAIKRFKDSDQLDAQVRTRCQRLWVLF